MTCIVTKPALEQFKSKKELKEYAEKDPGNIIIEDPSIFKPRSFRADAMEEGQSEVVTNHPKRSWFAKIERRGGKLRVT